MHRLLTFRWPKSDCDMDNCSSKYQLLLALVCWTWTCELSCWVYLTSNNPLVKITFYYDYCWCAFFNRLTTGARRTVLTKAGSVFWLPIKCIHKWIMGSIWFCEGGRRALVLGDFCPGGLMSYTRWVVSQMYSTAWLFGNQFKGFDSIEGKNLYFPARPADFHQPRSSSAYPFVREN